MIVNNLNLELSNMFEQYSEELYNIVLAFDKDRSIYGYSCKHHIIDQYRLAYLLALTIKDYLKYSSINIEMLSAKFNLERISEILYCNGIVFSDILNTVIPNFGGINSLKIHSTFIVEPKNNINTVIKPINQIRINKPCIYDN